MDKSGLTVVLLILLSVCLANLPFLNERLLACIALPFTSKPFWLRLFELTALYLLVGLVAHQLESNGGNVQSQRWEFYAITYCCFLVMAYPGFVWRYLRRQPVPQ